MRRPPRVVATRKASPKASSRPRRAAERPTPAAGKRGAGRWAVATQRDAATFFGISLPALRRWAELAGPGAFGTAGAWDLARIARWRVKRDAARRKEEAAAADPDLKLKEYRAKLFRLKYLQARDALVPKREGRQVLDGFARTCRHHLLEIARSLAGQLGGLTTARAQTVIEDRFTECLEKLSQYAGDGESEEDLELAEGEGGAHPAEGDRT